jgi:hypothetical protein
MKRIHLLILSLALSSTSFAQDGFENIITGTPADAKYLAEGYVSPMMKAFGYGLNNGWYTSGAPHKLGGFELTITSANVFVPTIDEKYFVDNDKMTSVELVDGTGPGATPEDGYVPTFFGGDTPPTYHALTGTGDTYFSGPVGLGLKFLPTPGLTLGIGLPAGFEVKLRYVPTVDFNRYLDEFTGGFTMFGVGVMHDIKQYIPGIKALPFDISAFVGYTKMKMDLGFDSSDPTKKGEFSSNATTIQGLISKKLSVLTVYGSVGYNMAKTNMGLRGSYDMNDDGDSIDAGEKDPFTIVTESNGMRATVGLRLRLAVIAFHGDYTMQRYGRVITGGFGINFR